jgi:D-glycero-D-manno-heptose 1,7-bisphosphate phosphatase
VHRAVFVDRDGVICRNRDDHVKSWEEFVFLPGAIGALVRLARCELRIVVVTNQAAIHRGIVSSEIVEDIHRRMVARVLAAGGRVDCVIYCPHRPDEGCRCRKPQPGMLLDAARKLDLNLAESYLIGDAETDILAAQAAGCGHRYLVLSGRGRNQLSLCRQHGLGGFQVMAHLRAATEAVLHRERCVRSSSWGWIREGIDVC